MHGTTFEGGYYPGTKIRLIRGGAPDAPASGETPPATPPAGDPPPTEPDYQAKYAELEGRYKPYEELKHPTENRPLTPQEIKQAIEWGRSVYPVWDKHQKGELVEKSLLPKAPAQPEADPLDGIDDLPPREQVGRMLGVLKKEVGGLTRSETEAVRAEMKKFGDNLAAQQQLMFKLIKIQRENPDLDIDQLTAEATRASSMSSMDLLDFMAKQMRSPKEQQAAIEKAVAAERVKWEQEQQAKRVPPATRTMPRMLNPQKEADPGQRRSKVYENFLARLAKASNE